VSATALARPRPRDGAITGAVSLALLVLVSTVVLITAIRSPQKDDVAWLLYVARKWLGGKQLYVDLVEVNPPLIVWIYAIPAWIADKLAVEPKLAAEPFFALLMLGSAGWCAQLLHGRANLFADRLPVFSAIAIVLLALPGIEFGQREHLLIAAALPYLCLYARELDGEAEPRLVGTLAGIVAGLGCALKPTYAFAFLAIEAVALLRGHRVLRAAPLAAAAAAGLYGIGVLLFCPAFLDKAVPLALALYGGTDTTCWEIISESTRLLFGQAVIVLLVWSSHTTMARQSPFKRHLLLALTAFALVATVVFVLQGKNWFYHRLPATTATLLALILWIAAVMPRDPVAALLRIVAQPRLADLKRLAPAPLVLGALALFAASDYDRLRPWIEEAVEPNLTTEVKIERLIRKEHAHTYIAFSEWIALGFPVVNNTGVTWASRFDSMWAMHGELWRTRQDGRAPKAWPISQWVARDFVANCPDLAVVDTHGINFVAMLSAADADFARAWGHYQPIAVIDRRLTVYRHDGTACLPAPAPEKHLPQVSEVFMSYP
jgi:hypothetical protein